MSIEGDHACALVCDEHERGQVEYRKIANQSLREPTRATIEQWLQHAFSFRYWFAVLFWLVVRIKSVALGRVDNHDVRVLVDLRGQWRLLSDWNIKHPQPRLLTIPCCVNGHHTLLCVLAGMLCSSSILA